MADSDRPDGDTGFRTEHDSMGDVLVPADALWGAQTQRAFENFRAVSAEPVPRDVIIALARIKSAAAAVNAELGVIDADMARGIQAAARPAATPATGASTPASSRSRCSRPGRAPRPT